MLWSTKGAGLHYGGPGTSAFRLYTAGQQAYPDAVRLTLVHAYPTQTRQALFHEEYELPTFGTRLGQLRFIRAGKRWVREHIKNYDVMHALSGYHIALAPALTAERMGVPACVKPLTHNADFRVKGTLHHRLFRSAERRREALNGLSAVICISRSIVDECLGFGVDPERVAWIPNGCDTERFRPVDADGRRAAREALALPDRPTLLISGTILHRKRADLVIGAIDLLKQRGIDAQAVLLGPESDAEYCKGLRAQVAAADIGDLVHFVGFHEDPAPFYAAADLFCLPSHAEGMPNAMLEAMACGVPSIGTRISGITDLITDGVTGRFVDFDAADIADAAAGYLQNNETWQAASAACRTLIETDYSATATFQRHLHLFRNMMTGKPAADAGMKFDA
ncbi:MAG: glycosyltransferase family 4 protein [Planctomycetota bacterium]